MTLTIQLAPQTEARLLDEASRLGMKPDEYASHVLETSLGGHARSSLSQLIQQWTEEGDEEEQRDTFEALRQGLNESHSSDRRIFL